VIRAAGLGVTLLLGLLLAAASLEANVDPALVRFASDLEWLKSRGIEVERFNLSQDPAPFVGNPLVAHAMRTGDNALPLLLVDGKIAAQGPYPAREALAALVPERPGVEDLYFIGVAPYSAEDVFARELLSVRALFDARFGTAGRSLTLVNSPSTLRDAPIATATNSIPPRR